MTMIKTQFFC